MQSAYKKKPDQEKKEKRNACFGARHERFVQWVCDCILHVHIICIIQRIAMLTTTTTTTTTAMTTTTTAVLKSVVSHWIRCDFVFCTDNYFTSVRKTVVHKIQYTICSWWYQRMNEWQWFGGREVERASLCRDTNSNTYKNNSHSIQNKWNTYINIYTHTHLHAKFISFNKNRTWHRERDRER